jgi:TPR repeat protein
VEDGTASSVSTETSDSAILSRSTKQLLRTAFTGISVTNEEAPNVGALKAEAAKTGASVQAALTIGSRAAAQYRGLSDGDDGRDLADGDKLSECKAAVEMYRWVGNAVIQQKNALDGGHVQHELVEQVLLQDHRQVAAVHAEEGMLQTLRDDVLAASAHAVNDGLSDPGASAYSLGQRHEQGASGLPVDVGAACEYYREAGMIHRHPQAILSLGTCYLRGLLLPEADAKQKRAALGLDEPTANSTTTSSSSSSSSSADSTATNTAAADTTAVAAADTAMPTTRISTANATRASELFTMAAGLGAVGAMAKLGEQYLHGLGVEQNISTAEGWYLQSAGAGDVNGMMGLGLLHFAGWIDRNMTAALPHFERASRSGFQHAHFYAAMIHGGMGTFNCSRALHHWRALAEAGPHASLRYAHELHMRERPIAAAIAYQSKATQGHLVAQKNAAHLLSIARKKCMQKMQWGWSWWKWLPFQGADPDGAAVLEGGGSDGGHDIMSALGDPGSSDGDCSGVDEGLEYWLRMAAEQGSVDAMVELGDLHYSYIHYALSHAQPSEGEGLGEAHLGRARAHLATAVSWYRRATGASSAPSHTRGGERTRADVRAHAADARAYWNLGYVALFGDMILPQLEVQAAVNVSSALAHYISWSERDPTGLGSEVVRPLLRSEWGEMVLLAARKVAGAFQRASQHRHEEV